jgi:glycosyltransferase involved in cell wall biosynthesis
VGGLAEPGDPESLAAEIVRVLEAPDRAAMGARARERVVSRWSNDRLAERHLEIYTELLQRRRRTR